jgi:hypothetical protein
MPFRTRFVPFLLAAAFAAGCSDAPTEVEPAPKPGAAAEILWRAAPDGVPKYVDEEEVSIARILPEYGGHFIDDDGSVVVYLTDLEQAAEVTPIILRHLRATSATSLPKGVNVRYRQAEFDFLTLSRWRSVDLPRHAGRIPGVRLIGTDIRNNRISVGIEGEDAREAVLSVLRANAIPSRAVDLQLLNFDSVEKATAFDQAPSSSCADCLTGYTHTLRGGWRIWGRRSQTIESRCTLAMVGRGTAHGALGSDVGITSSHCTATMDQMDGTEFRQPDQWDGVIGAERWDGSVHPRGDWCNYFEGCRHGDVAILRLNYLRNHDIGSIQRPDHVGTNRVSQNREFPIYSLLNGRLNAGAVVQMVGSTSGWQSGTQTQRCYDVKVFTNVTDMRQIWLVCQGLVRWGRAEGGDSGAPVFREEPSLWSPDFQRVQVVGFHAGGFIGADNHRYGWYSSALGALNTDRFGDIDPFWGVHWTKH